MRSCTVGHASNILPVVKVVSRESLFPWYPSSLRTVNCTHSICKLIFHYCVFKNNCSLITVIKEGFGEPLAFYLHTHPLTVFPIEGIPSREERANALQLVSFRPFTSGPSAWEGRSQATAWWLGDGGLDQSHQCRQNTGTSWGVRTEKWAPRPKALAKDRWPLVLQFKWHVLTLWQFMTHSCSTGHFKSCLCQVRVWWNSK